MDQSEKRVFREPQKRAEGVRLTDFQRRLPVGSPSLSVRPWENILKERKKKIFQNCLTFRFIRVFRGAQDFLNDRCSYIIEGQQVVDAYKKILKAKYWKVNQETK